MRAHARCWERFQHLLTEMVLDLALLKTEILPDAPQNAPVFHSPVSRRMWLACSRHRQTGRLTPMAAVAGSVAEEMIAFYRIEGIARAWINNGGDIALHLSGNTEYRVGLVADIFQAKGASEGGPVDMKFLVSASGRIRGVATSGRRGRSFSLGIADSVTVFAADAASADAAATVIANAVDLADAPPGVIERRPANALADHSDLGERLVTVAVIALSPRQKAQALAAGAECARRVWAVGLIEGVVICLQGQFWKYGAV
jgi:ApbE superfamily uncharacterized protein (UPF0280 family)